MRDTSELEPGTVVAGRYRVASKIGHGGMGAVYLVHHVHTDESLALKVLHPQILRDASAVERFRREARAPARITSEHVARVTDADTAADLDGAPFYVMELLRGRDLDRVLAEDGPLPPVSVVEYLAQAARALDKAHALGVVHRDLKPENLFLTHREDGSPCIKLLDFGIARLGVEAPRRNEGPIAEAQIGGPMVTQAGYVFGTPNCMAPEQATGEPGLIGPATDVWALGLLAFKLLVGRDFFGGSNATELYAQILVEPIPPPSARGATSGPAFDAWFARCVTRSIEHRFASAGAAIAGLSEALGIVVTARAPSESALVITPGPGRSHHSFDTVPPVTASSSSRPPPDRAPALPPAALPRRSRMPTVAALGAAGALVVASGFVLGLALVRRTPKPGPASGIVVGASSVAAAKPAIASPPATPEPGTSEPAASEPTTSVEPASAAAEAPSTARAAAAKASARATATAATATPSSPSPRVPTQTGRPTEGQQRRLETLHRLCAQGTYSATECEDKRRSIMRGGS